MTSPFILIANGEHYAVAPTGLDDKLRQLGFSEPVHARQMVPVDNVGAVWGHFDVAGGNEVAPGAVICVGRDEHDCNSQIFALSEQMGGGAARVGTNRAKGLSNIQRIAKGLEMHEDTNIVEIAKRLLDEDLVIVHKEGVNEVRSMKSGALAWREVHRAVRDMPLREDEKRLAAAVEALTAMQNRSLARVEDEWRGIAQSARLGQELYSERHGTRFRADTARTLEYIMRGAVRTEKKKPKRRTKIAVKSSSTRRANTARPSTTSQRGMDKICKKVKTLLEEGSLPSPWIAAFAVVNRTITPGEALRDPRLGGLADGFRLCVDTAVAKATQHRLTASDVLCLLEIILGDEYGALLKTQEKKKGRPKLKVSLVCLLSILIQDATWIGSASVDLHWDNVFLSARKRWTEISEPVAVAVDEDEDEVAEVIGERRPARDVSSTARPVNVLSDDAESGGGGGDRGRGEKDDAPSAPSARRRTRSQRKI